MLQTIHELLEENQPDPAGHVIHNPVVLLQVKQLLVEQGLQELVVPPREKLILSIHDVQLLFEACHC